MTLLTAGARRRGAGAPTYDLIPQGTLNTVPTYDGSGITTHPSVVDMGTVWNGYRWWLADTPYPNADVSLENPCIWGSNDRITWVEPRAGLNPLVGRPSPAYFNADTELVWDPDGQRMICYWCEGATGGTRLRMAESANGTDWTVVPTPYVFPPNPGGNMSPAVCRIGPNDWRMWTFGYLGKGIYLWQSTDPIIGWAPVGACAVTPAAESVAYYHADVLNTGDLLLCMASDGSGPTRPGVSTDGGLTWVFGSPISMITPSYITFKSYRPTFCLSTEAGYMDVWVSADNRVRYWRFPLTMWTNLLP